MKNNTFHKRDQTGTELNAFLNSFEQHRQAWKDSDDSTANLIYRLLILLGVGTVKLFIAYIVAS